MHEHAAHSPFCRASLTLVSVPRGSEVATGHLCSHLAALRSFLLAALFQLGHSEPARASKGAHPSPKGRNSATERGKLMTCLFGAVRWQ